MQQQQLCEIKNCLLYRNDCLAVLRGMPDNCIDAVVTDPPAGISFMGKEWDSNKGGSAQWTSWLQSIAAELLRVLKPGAHGLVWAIPRTSHWAASAFEGAGFEIRDVVTHLFGTGFPKSMNVGKKLPEWDGWGTALKPASEHWILVRNPLSEKTVAKNVLKWGVGGLNIDECRVGAEGPDINDRNCKYGNNGTSIFHNADNLKKGWTSKQGRFPANLILSDDAPEMLDKQSGVSEGHGKRVPKKKNSMGFHGGDNSYDDFSYPDSGGASRFFYCAKASKSDRGDGNNHPTVKSTALMEYLIKLVTPPDGIVLDPFTGSGSTGVAAVRNRFRFVGIELDAEYFEIARNRIKTELGVRDGKASQESKEESQAGCKEESQDLASE